VRDRIAGACSYCAAAYGVKDQVEAAGVDLLDESNRSTPATDVSSLAPPFAQRISL
jgi:hypothetical protein